MGKERLFTIISHVLLNPSSKRKPREIFKETHYASIPSSPLLFCFSLSPSIPMSTSGEPVDFREILHLLACCRERNPYTRDVMEELGPSDIFL
jgi:hypothetical protein